MLSSICLLTALIVAVLYPLCFWISFHQPLKNNFHHFHLGLPAVLSGMIIPFILRGEFENHTKILALFWLGGLLLLCMYYWKKEFPQPIAVTGVSLVGLITFIQIQKYLLCPFHTYDLWSVNCMAILGGSIFCAALFAMNLGHWYLNVHGLPIAHLKRATDVFVILVLIRLIVDAYFILSGYVNYLGEDWRLYKFLLKVDGFFLWVAIIFGIIFPLVSSYFVYGTLKLKNTQSATGILYVILASILLGDITYKYFLIKFGIVL